MRRFLLFIAAALLAASPAWALTPAQRVVLFSGGGIYTIVSSNENAGDQAGSGPGTTTVTLPKVVAGDVVFIEGGYCQTNNACSGGSDDFSGGSATSSVFASCLPASNQNVTADNLITFQFACPATSSGTNVTITVLNGGGSNPMYFVQVAAQDVHSAIGWSGTPDQGLGKNSYSGSANTTPSVSSGTPVPVPSLAISNAFIECGTASQGAGWASLTSSFFTVLAQYKIPVSTGAVTATVSNPSSCGNNIQVDVYK